MLQNHAVIVTLLDTIGLFEETLPDICVVAGKHTIQRIGVGAAYSVVFSIHSYTQ